MAYKSLNKHFTVREPNKRKMDKFGSFDIETDGLNAKAFKLGVVFDGRAFYDFINAKEMFDFMCSRKFRNYKWYGHNVEYDLSGFVNNIITDLDDVIFSGSRLIMAKKHYDFRTGKNNKVHSDTVTFLDTFNLFNCSLKKVGDMIGIKKLECDFNTVTDAELLIYCRRDTEIVYRAVEFFNNTVYDLFGVNIGMTVGSTALKVYAAKFLKGIWFKLPRSYNDFWHKAYYGGRCEVFIKGLSRGPIYHYDINSLYPFTMLTAEFPDPNKIKITTGPQLDILNNKQGCADVTVKTPDINIPFLPYRSNTKLLFPVGTFRGVYNLNELRYAVAIGYKILECHKVMYSEKSFNPFADYVNKIYGMRLQFQKEKNPAEYLCKYLLNSLYGKFGEKHKDIIYGYENERDKYAFGSFFPMGDLRPNAPSFGYFCTDDEHYTNHTFYNICSYVTSQARCILYDYFLKSDMQKLIYCDTDSLFLTKPIDEKLLTKDLGGLKCEGVYDYGIFLKPKMYAVECNGVKYTKIKGIPSRAADIMKTTFTFDRVVKSKESLRRKLIAGLSMSICKEITFDDEKRNAERVVDFYKNCVNTTPLSIKQLA